MMATLKTFIINFSHSMANNDFASLEQSLIALGGTIFLFSLGIILHKRRTVK